MNLLQRAINKVYNVQLVFRFHENPPTPFPPDERPEFEYLVCDEELLERYFADDERLKQRFTKWMNEGSVGAVVVGDGEWASYVWLRTPDAPPPLGLPGNAAGKEYWLYYSYTKVNFRGKGLYKRAMAFLMNEAFKRDPQPAIYGIISPINIPPRKALRSLRFEPAGVLTIYSLWIPKLYHYPFYAYWRRNARHDQLIKDEVG